MPPDRLIHPFPGQVVVVDLPYRGGPLFSTSSGSVFGGTWCIIRLPRAGDLGISAELRDALYLVELAHCNESGSHLDPNAHDIAYSGIPTGWRWPGDGWAYLNQWGRQWTEVDLLAMCRAVGGCPKATQLDEGLQ